MPSIPTPCHCIELRRASNALTALYDRALAPLGMSLAQYSVLSRIRKLSPCTVSELAVQLRLERTTVVRNLKPMVDAGWIHDDAHPGRRDRRLRVTSDGISLLQAAKPLWEKAQKRVEHHLGTELMEALCQALQALETIW